MEPLITYLLQYGNLTDQQITLIQSKAQKKLLKKGAYFSEAGKVSQEIGYITEGVFRLCYYSKTGESFTRYFVYENKSQPWKKSIEFPTRITLFSRGLSDVCVTLLVLKTIFQYILKILINSYHHFGLNENVY